MVYYKNDVLCHHGIQGQKWGVRRFQSKDGRLTPDGRKRYDKKKEEYRKAYKSFKFREEAEAVKNRYGKDGVIKAAKYMRKGKSLEQAVNKIERQRELVNFSTYIGNTALLWLTGGNVVAGTGQLVRASINTINNMKINKGRDFTKKIIYEKRSTAKEARKKNDVYGFKAR